MIHSCVSRTSSRRTGRRCGSSRRHPTRPSVGAWSSGRARRNSQTSRTPPTSASWCCSRASYSPTGSTSSCLSARYVQIICAILFLKYERGSVRALWCRWMRTCSARSGAAPACRSGSGGGAMWARPRRPASRRTRPTPATSTQRCLLTKSLMERCESSKKLKTDQ